MKRSQLIQLIKEAIGYSKYAPGGTTKGGTTDDFRKILTAIAKQRPEEEDSEEERARRGNAILDKANPENVARISRGEKPMYEGELKQINKQQAIDYLTDNDAKQYIVDVSRGVGQRFNSNQKQDAIDTVANSWSDVFEILHQGDIIRVYMPYDQKHGDVVRAMGGLD